MKYETPKYNLTKIEANDVITASPDKYEIEQSDNGTGNVIMNAFDIFK